MAADRAPRGWNRYGQTIRITTSMGTTRINPAKAQSARPRHLGLVRGGRREHPHRHPPRTACVGDGLAEVQMMSGDGPHRGRIIKPNVDVSRWPAPEPARRNRFPSGESDILAIWHGDTIVIPAPSLGKAPGSHWDLDGSWVPVDFLAASRPRRGATHGGATPFVAGAQGIRLRGRCLWSSRSSRTRPARCDRTASTRWLALAAVPADGVLTRGGVGDDRDGAQRRHGG